MQLVEQADPTTLVAAQIDHNAALRADPLQGAIQLRATVTALRAEHITGQALRMHSCQWCSPLQTLRADRQVVLGSQVEDRRRIIEPSPWTSEALFVASSMFKQPFKLRTGQCLDDPRGQRLTFDARVVDGVVQVLAPPAKETMDKRRWTDERRLPGVDVIGAWVELVEPRLDEVMSKMARPAVVGPLLLSTGRHRGRPGRPL